MRRIYTSIDFENIELVMRNDLIFQLEHLCDLLIAQRRRWVVNSGASFKELYQSIFRFICVGRHIPRNRMLVKALVAVGRVYIEERKRHDQQRAGR